MRVRSLPRALDWKRRTNATEFMAMTRSLFSRLVADTVLRTGRMRARPGPFIGSAAGLVLLGVGARCSSSPGFDPIVACNETQSVAVHVETFPATRFTWTPACGMASLIVWPDTGSAVWQVSSWPHSAENPLPSGITYGHLPPDGVDVTIGGVQPLVHGDRYQVIVYRCGGIGGCVATEAGEAYFTP